MTDQPRPPEQPEQPEGSEPSAYPPPPPSPSQGQSEPYPGQPPYSGQQQGQPPSEQPAPYPGAGDAAGYQGYPAEAAASESRQPGYAPTPTGSLGKIRGTGTCVLLFIVTLGIYSWYYWYSVHKEMKDHSGRGLGGGIALVLAIFVSIVMPFLQSDEVGQLYAVRGQEKPVSGLTGLWYFPGIFILVGPIIWFVKTNNALNEYWRKLGVQD
ncbi:MAG: DUF4234 domain-containing protein [Nocardioidaceae bacterium]